MAATAMTSGEEPPSDEALDASFLLLQLLGKGSYGSGYMGQARDTGQLFAIKVITLAEGVRGGRSLCTQASTRSSLPWLLADCVPTGRGVQRDSARDTDAPGA